MEKVRKKKYKLKKKVFFSRIILLVVAFLLIKWVGSALITVKIIDKSDILEITYNDSTFNTPSAKCTFLGIKYKNVDSKSAVDITKLGSQDVKYNCGLLFFNKSKTISYNVVDKDAPIITLNGDREVILYAGTNYEDEGVQAFDNVDGNITNKIVTNGNVDINTEGTYEIIYTAKDSSGNETVEKRSVEVKPKPKSSLVCGNPGVIYLTFDDGPNANYTSVILDALKKYNVKATFFVTSSGPDELIKRESDEGHLIAIHTSTHDYATIYKSTEAFWNDMNNVSNRVERLTGKKPTIFRFPGGSSNTVSKKYKVGIMSELSKQMEEKGYTYFDWNISAEDAAGAKSSEQVYNNVTSRLSKSKGNVVLMHDIKKITSEAIENIIKYGLDNGYKFDVLSKYDLCHQKINN